jgi:hypothetical protein
MKIRILGIFVVGFSLICSTWADDLPRMGYEPQISVEKLTAKGYRWVKVNGPYGCANERALRQITGGATDLTKLNMVEEGAAYYLTPGTLVRIIRDNPANGMSEILVGGIIKPLWTYTRFLTAHPLHDIYGIVETPDTAGLIDSSDAAEAALAHAGPTPAQRMPTSLQSVQQEIHVE